MKKVYPFAVCLIILASCKVIKPIQPTVASTTFNTPPPPPSNIDVPITIDFTDVFKEVDQTIPYNFNSGGEQYDGCGIKYQWNFSRDKLNLGFQGNALNLSTTGYYSVQGCWRPCGTFLGHCVCGFWICAGCGQPNLADLKSLLAETNVLIPQNQYVDESGRPVTDEKILAVLKSKKLHWEDTLKMIFKNNQILSTTNTAFNEKYLKDANKGTNGNGERLSIGISSALSVTPQWALSSRTVPSLNPIDRCKITFLSIDVTDRIIGAAGGPVNAACQKFDARLAQENLKTRVEPIWQKLFTTFPIPNLGFLQINPQHARLSSINSQDNNLNFSIGLTASPQFSMAKPQDQPDSPLPDIDNSTPGTD
jgi:hypothetical protein